MIELLAGAVVGYLIGSVSFSRIVAARFLEGEEIETTTYSFGGRGFTTETRGHSPGAVGRRAGPRAGGLATIGDILKAAVATGVVWLVLDRDAAAAAGAGAVLGHVAPLYHRFRGAFGQSPVIGAALVLSPLGLPFAIVASAATAVATAELIWVIGLWPVFLLVWGVMFSDAPFTWFAVVANAIYLWRAAPSVVQRVRFRRERRLDRRERLAELWTIFRTPPSGFQGPPDGTTTDPTVADEPDESDEPDA